MLLDTNVISSFLKPNAATRFPAVDTFVRDAELWARLKTHKPSLSLTDADLLIAATAGFHRRTLVTAEKKLVENLQAVGFDDVHLITEP